MTKLPELFGTMVFNEAVMKERLPKDTYKALKQTVAEGKSLDVSVANVVANAMKDWAIEKGVTHFTHWFQPLTGVTAEKHDSFISPTDEGHIIMEFSGKELIQGEPDASSFPSGGLRATFEARGYTTWDPTSYAFIKDNTLCIPTAFCSYGGEALDKKTPLLRSMESISKEAVKVLNLMGYKDVTRVTTTVGPEQEYFLIRKEDYETRKDLIFTGRTLLGAKPPKGQEMDDHYFGTIKPCVKEFMTDLDNELWKLGILAKTEHNEVAPAQHELAPIFSTTNIATDHNQLTMEIIRNVAARHGLICLLHEKPFDGVNGSGKHNNWSISTNTGKNLLSPGKDPANNTLFQLVLAAVVKAVDDYQALLRISVASPGNDHRLGANEAPPAIISIFLGDELGAIVDSIVTGKPYHEIKAAKIQTGVDILPDFKKDTTDRNRTSPFAFTGNKFEFRMLGSEASIADANTVLNTIVAESFKQFADELEGAADVEAKAKEIIKTTLTEHYNIIFNGNNYAPEWVEEAKKRGLLNLKSTVDAMPELIKEKNVKVFTDHGIFTEAEIQSRYEVNMEHYAKVINIEALTMLDMIKKDVMPAVSAYSTSLCDAILTKRSVSETIPTDLETSLVEKITSLSTDLVKKTEKLEAAVSEASSVEDATQAARVYHDSVLTSMEELRATADTLEELTSADYWPYPSYGEMLFYVK